MIQKTKEFYGRWKSSKNIKHELDVLLQQANPQVEHEARLVWLVNILEWIRYSSNPDYKEIQNVRTPSARIKFLLQILDRNPVWKENVAQTLRSIVRDTSCVEIFAEIGLPGESGVLSEFRSRFFAKLLPNKPLSSSSNQLFSSLFPYNYDIEWMSSLDPQLMKKIIELFFHDVKGSEAGWNTLENDVEQAIHCLITDVHARSLSPLIRKRLGFENIKDLPFFELAKETDNLFQSYHFAKEGFLLKAKDYRKLILKCQQTISNIYEHLDAFGVNVSIVYQLETIQSKLRRADDLVCFLMFDEIDHEMLLYFLIQLAEENQNRESLFALFNQNTELLARKIVERSAETGEHYITRTKAEYTKMFKKAAGGGAYTALTVYIKFLITKIGMVGFFEGFYASLNYAASFVAIQLSGFTLATKQPAMTGPALASKLQYIDQGESIELFVDEVVHLIRTQVVGVLGNVGVVVPVVLVINYFAYFVFGSHLLGEEKSLAVVESTNILGPTIIYASFTGVLLWASSIFAGWMDNWFFFNNMKTTIIYNRKFQYLFGKDFCMSVAGFLEKNISGLAANISLGFLLGLLPEVLKFFAIPLEVRHVTLSSGSLAAAIPTLGWGVFYSIEVYLAIAGIVLIGTLNLSVSFGLALYVAIKSRKIKPKHRRHIIGAVWKRFKREPLSFFYAKK